MFVGDGRYLDTLLSPAPADSRQFSPLNESSSASCQSTRPQADRRRARPDSLPLFALAVTTRRVHVPEPGERRQLSQE